MKTRQQALEHFQAKSNFSRFDKEVLQDYIKFGTVIREDQVKLFFEPSVEAEIYRTLPHNFYQFRHRLKTPAAYIGEIESREARLARLSFMQKKFNIDFHFLPGTHLFPLEIPLQTASFIKQIVK